MLTCLRAETGTFLAASFNTLLSIHFWVTTGAGTIVLTALSSSVSKRNGSQKASNRQKVEKLHKYYSLCVFLLTDMLHYTHICICECSFEKVCWFGGACPSKNYFYISQRTIVSTTSFSTSIPTGPAAGLSVFFSFSVTDRDCNWRRTSRGSKWYSEATCLQGSAAKQLSRENSHLKYTNKTIQLLTSEHYI